MIDTDVAIHLRDGDAGIRARMADLDGPPSLSLISLVELLGGTASVDADGRARRRERLSAMLEAVEIVPFDRAVVDIYATIVGAAGFSRPRVLDRLIAATAIVHDLTLITINGRHYRDIPDLKLAVWEAPAAQ